MAGAPRELNPDLPEPSAKLVREAATTIARVCRLRGVARVDFLLDSDAVWVNEVNTIPGSLSKYLWEPSVPFLSLIDAMLDEAVARPTVAWTTEGADGTALRSAGSIAGKLG